MEDQDIDYFFDTYAVIEIIAGNSAYHNFTSKPPTITIFNLSEIYFIALKKLGEVKANEIYNEYFQCVVEISEEVLKGAMKFKLENNKKRLSYADCIGYIYSIRNKMKFLTGDKEFRGLKNVEFVK
ncbi:hypothetical protein HYT23_03440 [Candidatus Pacearchaeota archaeon]|nr:hypothetical protein [Candidatus Pacearchaeota archaeon]